MHKTVTAAINGSLFVVLAIVITTCTAPTPIDSPEKEEPPVEEEPPPEINPIGPVAADGTLETVTWNLEWYGHPWGPESEIQQTKNFLTVLDTLNADLYAFQEVSDRESLYRLAGRMKGYRGFVARQMGGSQKTAFVYNTHVIDSVSSGLIEQGQDHHDWASGRYPFYFKFKYKAYPTPVYAVVIHAKAGDDADDYHRRVDAAKQLYNYLTNNKPKANIIFLGDYNDDVDVSIYNEKISPYQPFIIHDGQFRVITKTLSKNSVATTVSYPDAVDHITISNELYDEYIPGSEAALIKWTKLVVNYGQTTSDHYPVWAKFKFSHE